MNEFEQWFAKHHPAKYPDNNPAIKAAYMAGYESARKNAADIVLEYNTTAAFSSVVDGLLADIQQMEAEE